MAIDKLGKQHDRISVFENLIKIVSTAPIPYTLLGLSVIALRVCVSIPASAWLSTGKIGTLALKREI